MKQIGDGTLKRGLAVESHAVQFLKMRHYIILAQNIRFRFGEIDILAHDLATNDLVFIEVRSRMLNPWQQAIETVGTQKIRRLKRCIQAVISKIDCSQFQSLRVDVLAWNGQVWNHYQHVIQEGLF